MGPIHNAQPSILHWADQSTATAQLEDAHILFATFENELFHAPYFVAVDHETRAIVVAVRGTLSFADALVDMQVHEVRALLPQLRLRARR